MTTSGTAYEIVVRTASSERGAAMTMPSTVRDSSLSHSCSTCAESSVLISSCRKPAAWHCAWLPRSRSKTNGLVRLGSTSPIVPRARPSLSIGSIAEL